MHSTGRPVGDFDYGAVRKLLVEAGLTEVHGHFRPTSSPSADFAWLREHPEALLMIALSLPRVYRMLVRMGLGRT